MRLGWTKVLGRLAAFVLCGFLLASITQAQVIISEFMASNSNGLADEDGAHSDWIELQNTNDAPVSLDGWYLTDNAVQKTKWRIPGTNIAANGFLIVFASSKNRAVPGAPLHTSFNLGAGGEYLGLIQPDGITIASHYSPEFPDQYANISYGTLNGTNYYFATPTPGATNSGEFLSFVSDTKFSVDRGFFTAPTNLVITTAMEGATIRYTTDGTPPNDTNGLVYTAPIGISNTTVIRAAAFKEGYRPSNVDTHTYIFLSDVIRQSSNGVAPSGWPTNWTPNVSNYGMDPDVVDSPTYSGRIIGALQAIPTISIVMKLEDLFDRTNGIYANAINRGDAWERPTSMELIYPDGTEGFQVDAGIRIRGGFSRSTSNPKHSFRLLFRAEYGDAKLNYPLFGDSGASSFDGVDLPTPQNYTWHIHAAIGVGVYGLYLRDHFCRDTQLAMGHQGERGIYTHLYINGQYWGIYSPSERPEASYAASYFGGSKEDYDVIKATGSPSNTVEVVDGNMEAWKRLWQMATNGFASDANYQRAQGNNPDGTRNPEYEVLLDVPNLIDYMLIMFYSGSRDAPINPSGTPYNFFTSRNRYGSEGFKFFVHDFEHTLLDINEDRTRLSASSTLAGSNPYYFWRRLQSNENFRVTFADHVHRHFFNGGLLTPAKCIERFKVRTNQLDRALIGESARWGDTQVSTPYTRDSYWIPLVNWLLNSYFPQRSAVVLNQLKSIGLYPNLGAPVFSQHGGTEQGPFTFQMSAPAGVIYYTIDGSDPRLMDGTISPSAALYDTNVTLFGNATVKARAYETNTWSALNEATFIVTSESWVAWRERHFTPEQLDDLGVSGSEADPDGDGHTNYQEYIAGTLPLDATSVLRILSAAATGELITLTFPAVAGKTYTIQRRENFGGATWQDISSLPPRPASGTAEITNAIPGSNTHFWRVVTP